MRKSELTRKNKDYYGRFNMYSDAFAVINRDPIVRNSSSSGGFFSAFAEYIIAEKGVVVGAAFDEDFHVRHIIIDSISELNVLRGSKYVQSKLGDIFVEVKKILQTNRKCLFVGTPCQCEGLLNFVGRNFENLYTVDIICHGVPSSLVLDYYLSYIKKKNSSMIKEISFRDKTNGWIRYNMKIEFDEKSKFYLKWFNDDPFGQTFINNLFLRHSCYECRFKTYVRRTDFTMADFWGISDYIPNHDDKGYTLLIPHNDRAHQIMHTINIDIIKVVDIKKATVHNKSIIQSAVLPPSRDKIFLELKKHGINYIIHKYCSMSFVDRVKRKIRKIINKLS